MTDALSYALYFAFGKTSGPKATRDYRPRSSTFLGLQRWGQLQSRNKGYTLPAIDGLIAATAKVHNLILVTRNEKDFIKAPIKILNPWNKIEPD